MPPTARRAMQYGFALAGAGAALAVLLLYLPSRPVRDSILLVTLDTTRADHIGAYGSTRARTPHLDRLAAEGTRFARASATAPLTLPSHASLFTGLYPPEHGVRNNGHFRLEERLPTVASVLQGRGYRTGAFVSAFVLDRRFGLARGFDRYDDDLVQGQASETFSFESQRTGDRTAAALIQWVEGETSSPFLAWLHLYDAHEPYSPPSPFREDFKDAPYDGEIAFADAVLGQVLDALGRLHLQDRTTIVVVGDHGESLGEHGEETHSMFVYEGALLVPLVIWAPGRVPEGRVVEEPVSIVDLAPTLLELAGAPPLKLAHARSLLGLPGGSGTPRALYAETLSPQFDMGWAPLRSVRDHRYKLIDGPRPELFDLARDPSEAENLHERLPNVAAALRGRLGEIAGDGWGAMSAVAPSREVEEKLAALGYLGAGATPHTPPASVAGLTDPKEAIQVFNRLRHASAALLRGKPEETLGIVAEVDRLDPGNTFVRYIEAEALLAQGHPEKAIEPLRLYLARRPNKAVAHHLLAVCYLKTGDREQALRETDAALGLESRFVEARVLRARVLLADGRPQEAVRELRQAVEADPDKAAFRLALARALQELNQRAEAREQLERVLAGHPDDATALASLGALLVAEGDLARGPDLLRRALAADPEQDQARFILAQILEGDGRRREAEAEYGRVAETLRRTLAAEPQRHDVRLNLARVLERQGKKAEAAREYGRLADDPRAPTRLRELARQHRDR